MEVRMRVRTALFVVLSVALSNVPQAQSSREDEVVQVMTAFTTAFNNLDWDAFRRLWSDAPVMFQASGDRVDPQGFEARWRQTFATIRQTAANRGVTQPPYQNVQPRDLRIDFPSDDVAVVTFHLGSAAQTRGRRMFVVARQPDKTWKITHLHASNVPPVPAQ
jgi:ketosteroid isomerase-like protein